MNPRVQFTKTLILPLLSIAALIVFAALMAVPAQATPSCGLTSTNLLGPVSAGYYPSGSLNLFCIDPRVWLFRTTARGDSDLYITQNTFQAGGQSGWHTHPGPSLITVTEGTITAYEDDCTSTTYTVGDSFTDIGCGDVHNLVNQTGAEAKTVAVQFVPHGEARRIDVGDPGCSQVPHCP
jgi:quercetin dioxygenase-like cupin family protein